MSFLAIALAVCTLLLSLTVAHLVDKASAVARGMLEIERLRITARTESENAQAIEALDEQCDSGFAIHAARFDEMEARVSAAEEEAGEAIRKADNALGKAAFQGRRR